MSANGSAPACHLFSTLPTELQIKIWEYTLPGPRIIQVSHLEDDDAYLFQGASCPPALYTCKTSREVALRYLKPVLINNEKHGSRHETYINFAQDTIYLVPPFPTNACFKFAALFPDIKQIRFLAIGISLYADDEMLINMERAFGDIMTPSVCGDSINLREIIFVVKQEGLGISEFEFPEYVSLCKPEPYRWYTSEYWGDLEAGWTKKYRRRLQATGLETMERCSVRCV